MKKIKFVLIAVLLVVFLSGCDLLASVGYDIQALGHTVYYGNDSNHNFDEIQYLEQITPWIKERVTYRPDAKDTWYQPKETLDQGFGDCDDYTSLWMNIAYVRFGIKADFALCHGREVWDSGEAPWSFYYSNLNSRGVSDIDHAIVILDGIPFEPQTNKLYPNAKVDYICTFDNFFTN